MLEQAGSTAGHHGAIGAAAYCASKHGVHGLTKVAAKEYGSVGIRINAVAPGYIWTPLQEDVVATFGKAMIDTAVEAMPLPRFGQPEEVASMIAVLLSEESSFVTGSIVGVDGGTYPEAEYYSSIESLANHRVLLIIGWHT